MTHIMSDHRSRKLGTLKEDNDDDVTENEHVKTFLL